MQREWGRPKLSLGVAVWVYPTVCPSLFGDFYWTTNPIFTLVSLSGSTMWNFTNTENSPQWRLSVYMLLGLQASLKVSIPQFLKKNISLWVLHKMVTMSRVRGQKDLLRWRSEWSCDQTGSAMELTRLSRTTCISTVEVDFSFRSWPRLNTDSKLSRTGFTHISWSSVERKLYCLERNWTTLPSKKTEAIFPKKHLNVRSAAVRTPAGVTTIALHFASDLHCKRQW